MKFMFLQRNLALLFPSFLGIIRPCLLLLLIHAFLVLINMFVNSPLLLILLSVIFYCLLQKNPLNIWLHFIEIHFLFCVPYLTLQLSQSSDTSFHWVIKYLYLKNTLCIYLLSFFHFDSAVTNYENVYPSRLFPLSKIEINKLNSSGVLKMNKDNLWEIINQRNIFIDKFWSDEYLVNFYSKHCAKF